MPKVKLTPKDYGAKVGLKLNAITRAIRENRAMKGVLKVEKFGRFYLLTVNVNNKGEII